jgi:hypothetical protein
MPRKSNRSSSSSHDFGSDVIDVARDRPIATAATAAAAVGAGIFLWSRRNQISDQLSELSNQIREWSQSFPAPDDTGGLLESGETASTATRTRGTRGTRAVRTNRTGMSETGGGNASLGARSGGGGTTGSISGRGRARSTTPQATR